VQIKLKFYLLKGVLPETEARIKFLTKTFIYALLVIAALI